jgi:hypothetical protein
MGVTAPSIAIHYRRTGAIGIFFVVFNCLFKVFRSISVRANNISSQDTFIFFHYFQVLLLKAGQIQTVITWIRVIGLSANDSSVEIP